MPASNSIEMIHSLTQTCVTPAHVDRLRHRSKGTRAHDAIATARDHALNCRSRRIADVADRGLGRLDWADSGLTGVTSGTTGIWAKPLIPLPGGIRLSARGPPAIRAASARGETINRGLAASNIEMRFIIQSEFSALIVNCLGNFTKHLFAFRGFHRQILQSRA